MGAWSYKSFDNDSACDWLFIIESASDYSIIESKLNSVLSLGGDEYLYSDEGSEAIAAIDTLLRCCG